MTEKEKKNRRSPRAVFECKKKWGCWHGIYYIPLEMSESQLESVQSVITREHFMLKDRFKNGLPLKRRHGELTGRANKYEKRNTFIREKFKEVIARGMPEKAVFKLLNNELKKMGWGKLSDERLRKLV